MQQFTGRLTADAVVKTLDSGKEVVSFSIAENQTYKRKGDNDPQQFTTYFNCSYWTSTGIAQVLRKGAVVQINGRVSARAYMTNTGDATASLNLHANRIEVLSYAQEKAGTSKPKAKPEGAGKKNNNEADDLPF
ncbi:MAG: single-stranded DNA-binding protein [Bacteroidetes bacterium]|nr:single-stranded DNA-binding protein [Bacteroidota bacterium]